MLDDKRQERTILKPLPLRFLMLALMLALVLIVDAASNGTIQSLTASGGAYPGDRIEIHASFLAGQRINNSNVIFQIVSSNGVIVDAHSYSMPRMQSGETANYSWTSDSTAYPYIGAYTLQVCWSAGGSTNCNIDAASTVFYTADSLGPLSWFGLFFVGMIVFRVYRIGAAGG